MFIVSQFLIKGQIRLPSGIPFNFHGKLDKGVLLHFYKQGCRILESDNLPIRMILDYGAQIGDKIVRFLVNHPHAEIVVVEASDENFAIL